MRPHPVTGHTARWERQHAAGCRVRDSQQPRETLLGVVQFLHLLHIAGPHDRPGGFGKIWEKSASRRCRRNLCYVGLTSEVKSVERLS